MDKTYRLHQKKKSSSQKWLLRHMNDPYVHKAKDSGYRCRSAFKLKELQERYHLVQADMSILDLGSSPGGWSQLLSQWVTSGSVLAIDLLPMQPLPGVQFIQGDILSEEVQSSLQGHRFHLICSDMAPSLTGSRTLDRLQMETLLECIWTVAFQSLHLGGTLLVKAFHSSYLQQWKPFFRQLRYIKPKASRVQSREIYILAEDFKGMYCE